MRRGLARVSASDGSMLALGVSSRCLAGGMSPGGILEVAKEEPHERQRTPPSEADRFGHPQYGQYLTFVSAALCSSDRAVTGLLSFVGLPQTGLH